MLGVVIEQAGMEEFYVKVWAGPVFGESSPSQEKRPITLSAQGKQSKDKEAHQAAILTWFYGDHKCATKNNWKTFAYICV